MANVCGRLRKANVIVAFHRFQFPLTSVTDINVYVSLSLSLCLGFLPFLNSLVERSDAAAERKKIKRISRT